MILKGYIFSVLYIFLCLLIALVFHKFGADRKITRKIVHISVGFEWVILYAFMGAGSLHFLAVCLIFLLLLLVEYKLNLMPMMSSESDNAPGTVYYGLAMSVMAAVTIFVPDMIYPFGISVFCTSVGDGLAGLVGQGITRGNIKIWNNKTLFGTAVNLIACFAVVCIFSHVFNLGITVFWSFVIALFAAALELICERGLDNICITIGVSFLSYAVMMPQIFGDIILPIVITPILIAVVIKKKVLTVSATIAAVVLDVAVSIAFGNFGFLVLFAFLTLSIVSDKIKKKYKKTEQNSCDENTRGFMQVFANGFVAMLCALAFFVFDKKIFLIAYTASMAEALSDTFASGIGIFGTPTYDIFRLKKCDAGISGGVTLLGTLSALFSSTVIAFIPFVFSYVDLIDVAFISIAGFAGSMFDSFLGSLLQAKYRCVKCGKLIDSKYHCSSLAEKQSGISFITNGCVNFFSTLFSVILTFILYK